MLFYEAVINFGIGFPSSVSSLSYTGISSYFPDFRKIINCLCVEPYSDVSRRDFKIWRAVKYDH